MVLTKTEQKRLADIRASAIKWGAVKDTSTWETPFLLEIIDRMTEERAKDRRENLR